MCYYISKKIRNEESAMITVLIALFVGYIIAQYLKGLINKFLGFTKSSTSIWR